LHYVISNLNLSDFLAGSFFSPNNSNYSLLLSH